jgi:tetratricopeptide (TPR) repeat protein
LWRLTPDHLPIEAAERLMAETHREEIAKLEALYAAHPEGRVFTHLAEAYRRAGELDRAREILDHGLQRHADYASAHVVYGRVLADAGDGAGARLAFLRVLDLDSHNLVALRSLGELATGAGQPTEALEYYRELLALDPSDDELRATVGRLEDEARSLGADVVPGAAVEPEPVGGAAEALAGLETGGPAREPSSVDAGGTPTGAAGAEVTGETAAGEAFHGWPALADDEEAGAAVPADDAFGALAGLTDLTLAGWDEEEPPLPGDLAALAAASGPADVDEEAGPVGDPAGAASGRPSLAEAYPSEDARAAGESAPEPSAREAERGAEEHVEPWDPLHAGEPAGLAEAADAGVAGYGWAAAGEAPAWPAEAASFEPDAVAAEAVIEDGAWSREADTVDSGATTDAVDAADAVAYGPADEAVIAEIDAVMEGLDVGAGAGVADARGAVSGADRADTVDEGTAGPGGPGLVTATLAEIYAAQGFHERAAEVYRTLLAQVPDDARLRDRLEEAEARAAAGREARRRAAREAGSEDPAESVWTGGMAAADGGETPYAWSAAGDDQTGAPVGAYFRSLLDWRPTGAGPAGAGPDAGDGADAPLTADNAGPEPGAAASEPWGEDQPVIDASAVEAAFDDWFGESPAVPAADAGDVPRPGADIAGDGSDDDDLEAFRSWLQSLKK